MTVQDRAQLAHTIVNALQTKADTYDRVGKSLRRQLDSIYRRNNYQLMRALK